MITFERFEAAKMRRFISMYSKPYLFKRPILNDYKEPAGESVDVCEVNGVYHEVSYSHLSENVSDAGKYVKEIEPMVLCLSDENSDLIKIDDFTYINEKKMVVSKVKDINNSGFAYDISLRYEDNGESA